MFVPLTTLFTAIFAKFETDLFSIFRGFVGYAKNIHLNGRTNNLRNKMIEAARAFKASCSPHQDPGIPVPQGSLLFLLLPV
jgi:hypothetical protein